jgi:flavin-dependent dehydrogenase
MYDVIVVGARVAGSATAMLLARRGPRVLVLDRAHFPSDTLSTHQLQVPGVARLARWGLLDAVLASGTPPTRTVRFDPGVAVVEAEIPAYEGLDFMISPRRTVLDTVLVDAARAAGAEVRENTAVEEVLVADGRVIGVRAQGKGGPVVTEPARLVIGADGKHSVVAQAVKAKAYRQRPARTMAYYTYWANVPGAEDATGRIFGRAGRAVGAWPTNDGLLMTYVAWPVAEFARFRQDPQGCLLETLDAVGLGERIRAGTLAERLRGTPDLPSYHRVPFGPGWALVGDAGLLVDPITGLGMGHALRDAELLADAVVSGLDGGNLHRGLTGYQKVRDRDTRPQDEFTAMLAALKPPTPGERALFTAIAGSDEHARRFIGVIAGSVPRQDFVSPANLISLVGVGGLARLALRR